MKCKEKSYLEKLNTNAHRGGESVFRGISPHLPRSHIPILVLQVGKCSQTVLRLETTLQLDMKLCGWASCWEWFALSHGRNRALPTPVLQAGICSSPRSSTLIFALDRQLCLSLLRQTYPSCVCTRMSWITPGMNVGLTDFHAVAFGSTAVCKHGRGSVLAVPHTLFLAEDKYMLWGSLFCLYSSSYFHVACN